MIQGFFANLLARRFAFQVVVLAAVIIVGVNEYTYRTSVSAFRNGIVQTDQRLLTTRLLQALTVAESGQRSFLLTQDAAYLATYRKAVDEVAALRAEVVRFVDVNTELSAIDIDAIIDSRLSEMSTTISLANRGSNQLALDIVQAGAGSHWMDKFRQLTETVLTDAADRQASARATHFKTLAFNHAATVLLTLSAVFALYFIIRQLRAHIANRQTAQDELELTVEKRTLELRELAKYLQTVREAEKDHLARELHDQLGALLTVAKLDLEGIRKRALDMPDLTERLQRLGSRLNEVIALKRRMVEDMRPSSLTMLGLRSTLEQHCRDMAESMNISIQFDIDDVKLAAATELVIFRFVQEALTNMAKHSNANNVSVSLHKTGNQHEIVVSDDGTGFDVDRALAGHHGLTGMRYRIDSVGGIMTVNSKPGIGTTISAIIGS